MEQYPDLVFKGAAYSGNRLETATQFEAELSAFLNERAKGYYSKIVGVDIGRGTQPFDRSCNVFVTLENPSEHVDLAKRISGQFWFKGTPLICKLSNSMPDQFRNIAHMAWHSGKNFKASQIRI
jgi:hypothetical protein